MINWGDQAFMGQKPEMPDLPYVDRRESKQMFGGHTTGFEDLPALKNLTRQDSESEDLTAPPKTPLLGHDALYVLEKWRDEVVQDTDSAGTRTGDQEQAEQSKDLINECAGCKKSAAKEETAVTI